MRAGKPSTTAQAVAFWRALGDLGITHIPNFSDPWARHFVTAPLLRLLLWRIQRAKNPNVRDKIADAIDGMLLRVVFIDDAMTRVGARQVVNLGAGFDTRAWRLPALQGASLFEVDHPATQSYKRERARELPPPMAAVSYVPVDFTREDLAPALAAAGHDRKQPTLWLWEGVVMYLDDVALRSTLTAVRRLSAPSSTLIAHYHEPQNDSALTEQIVRRVLLRVWNEPQIGLRSCSVMHAEVTSAGFDVDEDAGIPEQALRAGLASPPLERPSRVIVAHA
jgi:methyltransferase (TIGR00027 family)